MAFSIDKEVIDLALAGDAAAREALTRALLPHIERQLVRYPVAPEDREDLLQSTLMQVLRRIGSFRGDSNLSTWLFRVTANEALMLMRSQRRHRSRLAPGFALEDLGALDAARDDGTERRMAGADLDRRVRAALKGLPNEYQDVISLHYSSDLSLQEIAEELGASESAIRSRLHRARMRLRGLLSEQGFGQEQALAALAA
jgi:RNA polymerase sigma-70 factor, ECF subfamily